MEQLKFYKQPFRQPNYGSWVYDAKHNFVFQFEEHNKFTNHNYTEGIKEMREQVIFSLNSINHEPIEGLNLSVNPNYPTQILKDGKTFILIRGWGNLTGIGGYNFDAENASKIQDEFRDWIIFKCTK